jgi:hypothetical protein
VRASLCKHDTKVGGVLRPVFSELSQLRLLQLVLSISLIYLAVFRLPAARVELQADFIVSILHV